MIGEGDIAVQTAEAYKAIKGLLEKVGMGMDNVTSERIYIVDLDEKKLEERARSPVSYFPCYVVIAKLLLLESLT